MKVKNGENVNKWNKISIIHKTTANNRSEATRNSICVEISNEFTPMTEKIADFIPISDKYVPSWKTNSDRKNDGLFSVTRVWYFFDNLVAMFEIGGNCFWFLAEFKT